MLELFKRRSKAKDISKSADFAIVTVIQEELDAVKSTLDLESSIKKEGEIYYHGRIADHFVVCARCLDRGNLPAQTLTSTIVKHWTPTYILVVGIAGGVEGRENIALGDVITSDSLDYYQMVKLTEMGKKFREVPVEQPSSDLRKLANHVGTDDPWWQQIKTRRPDNTNMVPKVVPGEILSGETLWDNPDSPELKELLDRYDKALAFEMESGGVARCVYDTPGDAKPGYLTIRGISDYVNRTGNAERRKTWTRYAADAGAAFALALIRNTEKKPVGEDPDKKYRESVQKSLNQEPFIRIFPKPPVQFGHTVSSEEEKKLSAKQLLDRIIDGRRVILRGSAGSGKSVVVRKLTDLVLENGDSIPVILNLKNREKLDLEKLRRLEENREDFNAKLDVLLGVSIADLHTSMFLEFPTQTSKLIIADGLNEVSAGLYHEDVVRLLVNTLDEYLRLTADKNTSVVITDRMTPRGFLGDRWKVFNVDPLDADEVGHKINDKFGAGTFESLSERAQSLLKSPYFLDKALGSRSPELGSRAKAIESFFKEHTGLDNATLDVVAQAAFAIYRTYNSLTFEEESFRQATGEESFEKLLDAGDLVKSGENNLHFDHQLKHDYLAARYLSKANQQNWEWSSFDAVSFRSNSFESLSMVLSQLSAKSRADEFLKRVYDWNWVGAVICMAEAAKIEERVHSEEMQIAILCVVAEKLFDKILPTRRRTRNTLSTFPDRIATTLRDAPNIDEVFRVANELLSKEQWFLDWRSLFTRVEIAPLVEGEINMINSKDSILGWTASNVIKRFRLNELNLAQLRTVYNTSDEETPHQVTVRWRTVHALGYFGTKESVQLLLQALDQDQYHWARYGTARSLVEIAARTDDTEMSKVVIEELIKRVNSGSLTRWVRVMEEIGNALFYIDARPNWKDEVSPLLQSLLDSQQSEPDRERWQKTVEEFINFARKGYSDD